MAGVLFDQGKSVFVTIYSLNILGSFLSDASQELETAAESQHDIAVSAKDAVGQLDKSTEGSELFIGLCLGAGFALVLALICCVLVKFLRSFISYLLCIQLQLVIAISVYSHLVWGRCILAVFLIFQLIPQYNTFVFVYPKKCS